MKFISGFWNIHNVIIGLKILRILKILFMDSKQRSTINDLHEDFMNDVLGSRSVLRSLTRIFWEAFSSKIRLTDSCGWILRIPDGLNLKNPLNWIECCETWTVWQEQTKFRLVLGWKRSLRGSKGSNQQTPIFSDDPAGLTSCWHPPGSRLPAGI